MESLINRITALHRSLKLGPSSHGGDPRLAAVVASCLRDLHGIAARSAEQPAARPRLRLVSAEPQPGKPGEA